MRIDHQQWLHQHQKQKSVHPYHLSILLANKADIIVNNIPKEAAHHIL